MKQLQLRENRQNKSKPNNTEQENSMIVNEFMEQEEQKEKPNTSQVSNRSSDSHVINQYMLEAQSEQESCPKVESSVNFDELLSDSADKSQDEPVIRVDEATILEQLPNRKSRRIPLREEFPVHDEVV